MTLQYVTIVLGLAAIVGLAVAREWSARAEYSFYSTYDTGPNGYRALYNVLSAERVDVMRLERPLGLLDPRVRTLVISSNRSDVVAQVSHAQLDAGDVQRLQRFVREGGRLVLLESPADEALYRAFKLVIVPAKVHAVPSHLTLVPMARIAMTSGVASVRAAGVELAPFDSAPGAAPLLGTGAGVAAFWRPYGKGEIVAIAAPSVFSNGEIGQASNARFAYNVLAGHGPVAFDERLHGYAVDASFWSALPTPVRIAAAIVAAMLALWLVDANVRSAPPLALDVPDERHSASYLAAMAALLRRARAAQLGIAAFYDDAVRRSQHRRDAPGVASAIDELARLREMPHPHDDALLRAARIAARLRKDLA